MRRSFRHTAAVAAGSFILSPALALLTGAVANADASDITSVGPVGIGAYTELFSYDNATGAFDNFLGGSVDSYPYQLDLYFDPAGSGNGEVLLTVPLLFQGGFTDVDGTITPISSVNPADFVTPDIGLVDLGGTIPPSESVVTFGPIVLGAGTDTLSVNSDTFALDNLFAGTTNGLPFDLDFATGAPGSDSSEFLLTVPALFQVGLEDMAGTITPLFAVGASVNPDLGLSFIGGL